MVDFKKALKAADKGANTSVAAQETGGAVGAADDLSALFEADAGAGQDFVSTDMAIPYLAILQKNSPQVDEASGKYIIDAKAGMVLNTVTGEVIDCRTKDGELVPGGSYLDGIFCAYHKAVVEWKPDRGGFVKQHAPDSPEALNTYEFKDAEGKKKIKSKETHNEMVETAYHYFIQTAPTEFAKWAVISMVSSQLKVSRKLNTVTTEQRITLPSGKIIKLPLYGMTYRLRTKVEKRDDMTWYGWEITPLSAVGRQDHYGMAKEYNKAVTSGVARAAPPPADGNPDPDKVPF